MERKIPNFAGTWQMRSSENFDELLKKLAVNVMLRVIAVKAASKPLVEITQDGETLSIKTSTTARTTHITFTVGQEFSEATVDGRPCTSFPRWETDTKISCEQTLVKGEGPKTSWSRELTNDGKLILTMRADDVVCTRVYERQ
ncbi:cellular retinoic acid-binding protein 2a [Larimichthys crocea]|uniref:Cellular retinoic acid-binding protein 1 n=1 Tax=Collichthys lucidus TaxID=240159 RepID=A0A4U5V2V8_COLLU|nr:cellular retinoic acid-binding protein 2 [Larimichthys crocea]TKS82114.1 Cellular retinoic acid-binding protein 2 [Collichthys lucidus]